MSRLTVVLLYPVSWLRVGRVTAFDRFGASGEESPDFAEQGACRKPGRGDPTESATEIRPPRQVRGKGETVR